MMANYSKFLIFLGFCFLTVGIIFNISMCHGLAAGCFLACSFISLLEIYNLNKSLEKHDKFLEKRSENLDIMMKESEERTKFFKERYEKKGDYNIDIPTDGCNCSYCRRECIQTRKIVP